MITQGSAAHPVQLNDHFFGPKIKEVHWGGGIGVLQIEYPAGLGFSFEPSTPVENLGPRSLIVANGDTVDKAALVEEVLIYELRTVATNFIDIRQLYDVPVTGFMLSELAGSRGPIERFDFELTALDELLHRLYTNPLTGEYYAASYGRFYCLNAFVKFPTVITETSVPFCEAVPTTEHSVGSEGQFDIVTWKILTHTDRSTRNLSRATWVIDFRQWLTLDGGFVSVINESAGSFDPNLPISVVKTTLQVYPSSVTLTVNNLGDVASDKPATTSSILSTPYAARVIAKFNRRGVLGV